MATAFTYNEDLASARNYLRFRIGDTNTTYRRFWDEELDAILVKVSDDVEQARGVCFAIMAQDPDRLMLTKDGTAGAFTLLAIMQLFARRSSEWHAS